MALLLATVIAPVEELIANAFPVFPERIEKVRSSPASGSEACTTPTSVPFGACSRTLNVAFCTVGASFTLSTVIVTVAVPAGVPLACLVAR